jgi:hypothetical protein
MARTFGLEYLPAGGPRKFSYMELKAATNDFSNIVGRGGYGVVYEGQLPDGRNIAVKRLRNISGGEAKFWAEVCLLYLKGKSVNYQHTSFFFISFFIQALLLQYK